MNMPAKQIFCNDIMILDLKVHLLNQIRSEDITTNRDTPSNGQYHFDKFIGHLIFSKTDQNRKYTRLINKPKNI